MSKTLRTTILRAGAAVACVAALVAPQVAGATTTTNTLTVSSSVTASCSIAAATLAFGAYSGSVVNQTTTISVNCTNTTPYNVGFDKGAGGASVTTRHMNGTGTPTNTLNYALYQDSGHATNWGNTVGTDTVTGTGTGSAQSITIYGQIAASQTSAPDTYQDTVTMTVTY